VPHLQKWGPIRYDVSWPLPGSRPEYTIWGLYPRVMASAVATAYSACLVRGWSRPEAKNNFKITWT